MYYGNRSCFVGGHVLWEDMYYGRTCIMGGLSCRSACLKGAISFRMMCLTGIHVLQEDRSYLRVCFVGHV